MSNLTGSVNFSHFAIIYTNATLACIFNSVLLYLIKTTVTKIGSYSKLLSVMAIFNMSYAVIHVFEAPFVLVDGHYAAFTPTGIFQDIPSISYPLTNLYCSFFGQSLTLLMYHFIYRYIAVCRNHLMEQMHQPSSIFFCILIYIMIAALWAALVEFMLRDDKAIELMRDVIMRKLGINVTRSGLGAAAYMYPTDDGDWELNIIPWLGALFGMIHMSISSCVMTFCAIRICRKLRDCQAVSSTNHHQLQVQLFRALIIQTVVPFVLEYGACFVIFVVPMAGLPIDVEFTTLCISTYPVLEPLVVIYFVRDYRTALLKKFRPWKKPVVTYQSSVTPLDASTQQQSVQQSNASHTT